MLACRFVREYGPGTRQRRSREWRLAVFVPPMTPRRRILAMVHGVFQTLLCASTSAAPHQSACSSEPCRVMLFPGPCMSRHRQWESRANVQCFARCLGELSAKRCVARARDWRCCRFGACRASSRPVDGGPAPIVGGAVGPLGQSLRRCA